jgi:hypothetical protein
VERVVSVIVPLAVGLASSAGPCGHVRQHHPGSPDRLLPCAWPECEVGVGEETLSVSSAGPGPLLLERRSLVLDGVEQVFLWHPCVRRR